MKMNEVQLKMKSLLSNLADGNIHYQINPATKEQIDLFTNRAIENKIDPNVIKQLVELYSVANSFYYEIIIGFHSCNDFTVFEWWNNKELWLGQRDFNTLRWANDKFCLGDATNISFSEKYKFDTLIELIEGCIKDINEADYFDKNNTNNND
jgi:hypothetical protein